MTAPRGGGRPSRAQAAALREKILDTATELFLTHGFGATSIEQVARRAQISKRTFYHRFADKAGLFEAVVRRLIGRWLPPFEAKLGAAGPLEHVLLKLAQQILAVALSPEALALHHLLQAEARRFPELARVMAESGARRGVEGIAALLSQEAGAAGDQFAAEQFMTMVLAVPQRRALGFGQPLDEAALQRWASRTVTLFLEGWRKAAAER